MQSLIGVGVLALDGYKNLILQLTYIEIVRTLTTWLSLDGIGRDAGFAIVALYIVFGKLLSIDGLLTDDKRQHHHERIE